MGQFKQTLLHENIKFLKEYKLRLVALAFVAATLFTITLPLGQILAQRRKPSPTNHNNIVSATETNYALGTAGVLDDSDQVITKADSDSASVTKIRNVTVDIPKDAEKGVTFGTEGQTLDIQLPNAGNAALAKQVASGVTGYDSGNGSANAVQPTEDGGLRMLTIIDNPNAPTAYEYKVSVPKGGRIELMPDGGAIIIAGKSRPVATVANPWAKDATGTPIQTHFTTDGRTLTQHVRHNVPGVVYPVVADPFWDSVKKAAGKASDLAKRALKVVWRGALGCLGGREISKGGVKYFVTHGGKKKLLSKLGTKWVPYVGWVSCGYGVWDGLRT